VLWESINFRNVFETKNDLLGYRIYDYEHTMKLIDLLQIQQDKLLDPYHSGLVYPLRAGLMSFKNVVTVYEIHEIMKYSKLFSWTFKEATLVTEQVHGIIQVFLYL